MSDNQANMPLPSSMATDLAELKDIEKVITSQLTELGQKIDSSFSKAANSSIMLLKLHPLLQSQARHVTLYNLSARLHLLQSKESVTLTVLINTIRHLMLCLSKSRQ